MTPYPYGHGVLASWAGTPETPLQTALRYWGLVHGEAPAACVEKAASVSLEALPRDALKEACSNEVLACTQPDLTRISFLDTPEGQAYSVRVHEYLHVLIICTGGHEGNTHADQVWRMVPASELPKISPWYQPWLTPARTIEAYHRSVEGERK